jgi:Fic family protein
MTGKNMNERVNNNINKHTNNNMNEYLNKKEFCRLLKISPHTAQRELQRAIEDNSGVVIKIGRTLRINFNRFIEWNSKNNFKCLDKSINFSNNQFEEKEQCQRKEIGVSIKEGIYGGSTTPEEESNSVSQLRQRIFKKR